MCGPGKTGSSTQTQSGSVAAPGNVQAWAGDIMGRAVGAASQPFKEYGGEFVAPINEQQTTAIGNINNAAGTYAPYAGAAATSLGQGLGQGFGGTIAGMRGTAANASLDPMAIQHWMSPFLGSVASSTMANLRQQQEQEQSGLSSNAIQSGAFGGDRAGVASANLARQQDLATGQVLSNLFNTGYGQALGAAQQQQQIGLSAAAQYASLANQLFGQGLGAAQGYANLGTTQQANQLGVANAQLGAGTLQQQTQQALDQAKYNQFLQEQAYPFQTTQFLANILQGISPVYGTSSTGTGMSVTPMSFFRRGGRVTDMEMGEDGEFRAAKAGGGGLSDSDAMERLLATHAAMYAPRVPAADQGPYGVNLGAGRPMQLPTAQLPDMSIRRQDTGLGHTIGSMNTAADFGKNLAGLYSAGKEAAVGAPASTVNGKTTPASGGWFGYGGKWGAQAPASTPTAQGQAQSVVYTDSNGQLVNADGSPVTRYASGGRVGFDTGGALSDEALHRIIGATFGQHHHQAARNDADSIWLPSRARGRMAFGLAPETPPATVMATPPALPAYMTPEEQANERMPGLGAYNVLPLPTPPSAALSTPAPPPTPPVTVTPSVPPPTQGQGLSAGANGGFWDRLRRTLEGSPGDRPDRYAQGERILEFADGGRTGLSAGGMPYTGDITDQYIPKELGEPDKEDQLIRAVGNKGAMQSMASGPMSSGLGSTIGNLNNVAQLGMTVAKLAPMIATAFAADGGRIHKDVGGGLSGDPVPEGPPPLDPKVAYKHNIGNITSPNGGFNGYATPEEGVAAAVRNAQAYQKKFNEGKPLSLMQIAEHWAPKDDGKNPMLRGNDPVAWASNVAKFMNVRPDEPVDVTDPRLASLFSQGVHRQEKGAGTGFDPAIYDRGVQLAFSGKPLTTIMGAGQLPTASSQVAMNGPPPAGLSGGAPSGMFPAPKESWWDKESGGLSGTERAIISVLSGLGGMASSPSRFFGGALLSGLGAGAGTYGQLAQKGKALDIQQQQANTAQVAKAIEVARYTQSNYKRFIGADGQPAYRDIATGAIISPDEYNSRINAAFGATGLNRFGLGSTPYNPTPVSGGTASPAAPAGTPAPAPATPQPTPIAPAPASNAPPQATAGTPGSHDVSQLQDEYNPQILAQQAHAMKEKADQMIKDGVAEQDSPYIRDLITRAQQNLQRADAIYKGELTPYTKDMKPDTFWVDQARRQKAETVAMEAEQGAAIKQVSDLRQRAQGAYDQKYRLDMMDHQFANMPQQGVMAPGTMATERTELAKTINTLATVLGGKPIFDPSAVGAAEELGKDTRRLGFELSKTMGHEPGFIVQSAIGSNPSLNNTPMGYRRIVAGMREAIQYEQDRSQFFDEFYQKNRSLNGAAKAFSEAHPAQGYSDRAILSTVDPRDAAFLRDAKGDAKKQVKAAIDQKYGSGVGDLIEKSTP